MNTSLETYRYSETNSKLKIFIKISIILLIGIIIVLSYFLWLLSKPKGEFTKTMTELRFLFSIYAFSSNDNLKLPHDIAVDKQNNFYVTDTGNSRILVFDNRGDPLMKFGENTVINPVGISVAEDNGDIYVSDRTANHVYIFSSDGKLKNSIYMHMPLDVDVVDDKVYITTSGSLFITKRNGKVVKKIGKRGRAFGNFDFPNGIAVGNKGQIYVSDLNNLRIQAFDKNGEFEWAVGEPPKDLKAEERRFGLPAGLALDEQGKLLLVDAFSHSIRILTNKGEELANFGERGSTEGQLYLPTGIAYAGKGKIAVVDKYNNRINVYRLTNLNRLD